MGEAWLDSWMESHDFPCLFFYEDYEQSIINPQAYLWQSVASDTAKLGRMIVWLRNSPVHISDCQPMYREVTNSQQGQLWWYLPGRHRWIHDNSGALAWGPMLYQSHPSLISQLCKQLTVKRRKREFVPFDHIGRREKETRWPSWVHILDMATLKTFTLIFTTTCFIKEG